MDGGGRRAGALGFRVEGGEEGKRYLARHHPSRRAPRIPSCEGASERGGVARHGRGEPAARKTCHARVQEGVGKSQFLPKGCGFYKWIPCLNTVLKVTRDLKYNFRLKPRIGVSWLPRRARI